MTATLAVATPTVVQSNADANAEATDADTHSRAHTGANTLSSGCVGAGG